MHNIGTDHLVGVGPNGEAPSTADSVDLSAKEIGDLRDKEYTVTILFHHLKTAWTQLQRRGLEERFADLGITIDGVYGAEFDAGHQVDHLKQIATSDTDALVSIPVDTAATAAAYRAVADAGIRIVFMDNVPDGFIHGDEYSGCVSSDNEGVGMVAGRFLREFVGEGSVGMINFDAPFYVTDQRERGARSVLEKADRIDIVAENGFTDPDNVSGIAEAMVNDHPELDGLFVSWSDPPCVQTATSLTSAGVDDLVLTTTGLSTETVEIIGNGGLIKATGAQFPYQQGIIEANMVGKALLGKRTPPYIASGSLPVYRGNLEEQYVKHYQTELPDALRSFLL